MTPMQVMMAVADLKQNYKEARRLTGFLSL